MPISKKLPLAKLRRETKIARLKDPRPTFFCFSCSGKGLWIGERFLKLPIGFFFFHNIYDKDKAHSVWVAARRVFLDGRHPNFPSVFNLLFLLLHLYMKQKGWKYFLNRLNRP